MLIAALVVWVTYVQKNFADFQKDHDYQWNSNDLSSEHKN